VSAQPAPNGPSSHQSPDRRISKSPDHRDCRPPAAIGRSGRLDIEFAWRRGRTIVSRAYAEPPYRVAAFDLGAAAYVMVVCSGPGAFPGDSLAQTVRVKSGARALLTSQAALQIHPGCGPPASLRHVYRLEPDAELHCHWDPVIPFAGAAFSQQLEIDADPASRLYWSDALMAGRISRGEAWRFSELGHELQLRVGSRLKYLERFRLTPGDRAMSSSWLAGRAGYFGTTIVKHSNVNREAAETLHRQFEIADGARVAVDVLEQDLLVARSIATSGPAFDASRRALRRFAAESIFQQPNLVGRK
jgi:urease accessory protein